MVWIIEHNHYSTIKFKKNPNPKKATLLIPMEVKVHKLKDSLKFKDVRALKPSPLFLEGRLLFPLEGSQDLIPLTTHLVLGQT